MSTFANHKFACLFVSQSVSQFGDWLKTVALIVSVYMLMPTPLTLVGLFLASVLPGLAGGWLGSVLHRQNRLYVMVSFEIIRTVAVIGVIGGLMARSLFLILLCVAVGALLSPLYLEARNRVLTDVVEARQLPSSSALLAGLSGSSMIAGCLCAGFFFEWVGGVALLWIAACLCIVSAGLLWMIRGEVGNGQSEARSHTFAHVRDGWRLLREQPLFLRLFGLQALREAGFGCLIVMFAFYALDELQAGGVGVGISYALLAMLQVLLQTREEKWMPHLTLQGRQRESLTALWTMLSRLAYGAGLLAFAGISMLYL